MGMRTRKICINSFLIVLSNLELALECRMQTLADYYHFIINCYRLEKHWPPFSTSINFSYSQIYNHTSTSLDVTPYHLYIFIFMCLIWQRKEPENTLFTDNKWKVLLQQIDQWQSEFSNLLKSLKSCRYLNPRWKWDFSKTFNPLCEGLKRSRLVRD